jgi:hypothetical protein
VSGGTLSDYFEPEIPPFREIIQTMSNNPAPKPSTTKPPIPNFKPQFRAILSP